MDTIYLIKRLLPSMGDAICVEPTVSMAHEYIHTHGGGQLYLQVHRSVAPFFAEHPLLDKVLYEDQSPGQGIGIETILNVETANDCPSLQSLMTGNKNNAAQLFCDATKIKGKRLVYDGRPPKLFFSDEEKRQIAFIRRTIPEKKIAIQIEAGHVWKAYPHLKQLVKLLRKDYQVFLTHDKPIPFKTESAIPLVSLPYRDLMTWLGAMDLFIGLDSGPTHLAAAIGTKVYGIFGPTDPDVILGMYGSNVTWNDFAGNCPRKHCWLRPCKKILCLRGLSPWSIKKDVDTILSVPYENPRLRLSAEVFYPTLAGDVSPQITTLPPSPPSDVQSLITSAPVTQIGIESNKRGSANPNGRLRLTATALSIRQPPPHDVAIMRLDGLGGTITLSDHAKKLHEKTGEKVTLVTRGYETLFEGNPHIDRIINIGMRDWQEASLIMRNNHESLAEIRFGLGKWYSQNGDFAQDFSEFAELFDKFPMNFKNLRKYNLHHVQLTDKTLGLPYDTIDMEIFSDEKFDIDDNYILINNGVDVIHKGMRQTKCWEQWNELVKLLPMKVFQVGTLEDPIVEGAVDIRDATNLKQLVYLVRKAKAIVVTEGGIMHLASATQNPNVIVLGGPTRGVLFEYPGHKWVTSHVCGECWSTTMDWYNCCPKKCDAVCMKTISPFRVAEVVTEVLEGEATSSPS